LRKRFKKKVETRGEKVCGNLQAILLTSLSFPSPRKGAGARSRVLAPMHVSAAVAGLCHVNVVPVVACRCG